MHKVEDSNSTVKQHGNIKSQLLNVRSHIGWRKEQNIRVWKHLSSRSVLKP